MTPPQSSGGNHDHRKSQVLEDGRFKRKKCFLRICGALGRRLSCGQKKNMKGESAGKDQLGFAGLKSRRLIDD
jgi:hypothetical protein